MSNQDWWSYKGIEGFYQGLKCFEAKPEIDGVLADMPTYATPRLSTTLPVPGLPAILSKPRDYITRPPMVPTGMSDPECATLFIEDFGMKRVRQ